MPFTSSGPVNEQVFRASSGIPNAAGGVGEVTARVDGRLRGDALFAPDTEGACWTGDETKEDEFMYRRIQSKTSVDVSETQGVAYAGYPDWNNGDCIDAYPGAAKVMS